MSRCVILLLSLFVVLSVMLSVSAQEAHSPPTQPPQWASQEELAEYVRKLQEYYRVYGGGRLGKRDSIPDRQYDSAIRPNALNDFLSQSDNDRSNY